MASRADQDRDKAAAPGRPRGFDADAALDRALACFRASGWRRTTYADLERATGLHRQSLIYAFGDKRALYEAALRRFADARVGAVQAALGRPGPAADAIRAVFALWLADARDPDRPGCLMVATLGEIGRDEPDLAEIVARARRRLVRAFADAFVRAADEGALRLHADPLDLAEAAVALGDGAMLHAQAGGADLAEGAFTGFLAALLR